MYHWLIALTGVPEKESAEASQRMPKDSMTHCKESLTPPRQFKGTPGYGDVWTFAAICADARRMKIPLKGDPDPDRISTSHVERQNLTMRMGMRRFTRLTNGFSRKVENLSHAVSLHYMHYNFARPHKALKERYPRTPAMAAGVADHLWSLEEIAALLD
jgi:hypothetical protein